MDAQLTVVLADDSAFARRIVTTYLADTEFKVVATAENGNGAIEAYRAHKPDITMLDVTMPDLSGAEVLKAIMEINPDAKVVMVSSLGTESMVTECLSIGAKAFVQKPADKAGLLAVLRKVVSE